MFNENINNEELENYVGPEEDDYNEGFPVSESERAFIENSIADKEAIVKALEEDNKNGKYDSTISNVKNEINGLKQFLGK